MNRSVSRIAVLLCAAVLALLTSLSSPAPAADAGAILEAAGVQGGFVVHLGCGDGKLIAAVGARNGFLVQGLDADGENVAAARAHIRSKGLYGTVTAVTWAGKTLPYVDNFVDLLIADAGAAGKAEIMRILSPGGVALVGGEKTVKPRPEAIDTWTHYLHDPSNNAVSHDTLVGPPRHLQWQGGPRWSRQHDHLSSVTACVCSGPRVFYIFDEASRASILTPAEIKLIARDAFNGTILWKRDIPRWYNQMMRLKSGPATLPRRLVAAGGRVYVTLGIAAGLSALDAATGKTIREYADTAATEEIIFADGVLFLVVNDRSGADAATADLWSPNERRVMALDADSGEKLWEKQSVVTPLTLAVDGAAAYFRDGEKIVCLDRKSGTQRWASKPLPVWEKIRSYFGPTLVVYEDVVLYAGGEKMIPHRGGKDAMHALSAETGEELWTAPHPPSGYQSPEDLLVAGGLVWTGATTSGGYDGVFTGRDPKTGKVEKEFPPTVETYWFHHRCYRAKATDDYVLLSRTGIEFLDLDKEDWEIHHWVRGACLYGIMPANGFVYAPQHPCGCYPEAKQDGFSVLAPAADTRPAPGAVPDEGRLEKGPAYGGDFAAETGPADWPTYRGDNRRSGHTSATVPAKLDEKWSVAVGEKLSSLTAAAGTLLVCDIDRHRVCALDVDSGKTAWEFTPGGRVDSPPTIWKGRALFGCADGWVYCLRLGDGALAWRYRAAPLQRQTMYFEQIESLWPVHGSLLVQDGVLLLAAGRSMFLDGGIRLLRLNPETGEKLSETVMDSRRPDDDGTLQDRIMILNMPVAKPDILSSDGKRVYMKSQVFDLDGNRGPIGPHSGNPARQGAVQAGEQAHLFCPSSFLDGSWWHRTYWVYGRSFAGGHGGYWQAGKFAPAGRIICFDDEKVYVFGREPQYYRWTTPIEHHLWRADRQPPAIEMSPQKARRSKAPAVPAGSWIAVENRPALNPAGTPLAVEAWVKAEKPVGVIVARGGPAEGYALLLRKGRPTFMIRTGGKLATVTAKKRVIGRWVHLAGVLAKDGTMRMYVDGTPAGSGKAPGLIAGEPKQGMAIGADDQSGVGEYKSPLPFTGLIDEVRVYFGAVTDDEIAAHAAGTGNRDAADAKLVLRYSFDKGDAANDAGTVGAGVAGDVKPADGKFGKAMAFSGKGGRKRRGRGYYVQFDWSEKLPFFVRGMAVAGDTIFAAGPPDLVDEDRAVKGMSDAEIRAKLAAQASSLAGKKGAILRAVAAADGKTLAEMKLDAPPAWDALIAAGGRIYLATVDGTVICLDEAR